MVLWPAITGHPWWKLCALVFMEMTGGRGGMCTRLLAPCGAAGAVPVSLRIEDPDGAERDHVDPGAEAILQLELRNDGDTEARGVLVTASAEGVTVESAAAPPIAPVGTVTVSLPLVVSEAVPCGEPLTFTVEATAKPFAWRGTFVADVERARLDREPLWHGYGADRRVPSRRPRRTAVVAAGRGVRVRPSRRAHLPPRDRVDGGGLAACRIRQAGPPIGMRRLPFSRSTRRRKPT
jgi:hypothetical protein